MKENNASTSSPSSSEQLLAALESLTTAEKMEVLWDVVSLVSQDLGRFNDPVLEHETDILDSVCCNIQQRLEEIEAVYGVS